MFKVVVFVLLVGSALGHVLPQALEDVHKFVQEEISKSEGNLDIDYVF